jgi:Autophagy receptor ATG43
MADSSIPIEIAGTLQAASINRHPDPRHDLNPSTAASKKEPVTLVPNDDISDVDEDEISLSVLRPIPRRQTLPPLPDLRFEQSYLRSIEKAESVGAITWITFRDQVCDAIRLYLYITSFYSYSLGCIPSYSRHTMGAGVVWLEILGKINTNIWQ